MVKSIEKIKKLIEKEVAKYPIIDYQFINPKEIKFFERVRYICQTECPRYGKSWSCPPAVGTIEACKERCNKFQQALLFTTIAEVEDIENLSETLRTRKEHEEITRNLHIILKENNLETLVLSAESCDICQICTYPKKSCLYPENMYPCIEGYGILVTDIAEKYGITFFQDYHHITWFSIIFFCKN